MRVILADDHRIVRDGLRTILEQHGVEVVGEAGDGREAVALAHLLRPDIAVVDVTMPELNGIDATRRITAEIPAVKVIGLSMNEDQRYVLAMLAAGARGYLLKNAAADELLLALHAVASGRRYLSPAVASDVERARGRPAASGVLTPREREVLQLVAEGRTSKEIAVALDIALPTVETHRRQLMAKLRLRTIAELTKYAIREGLTPIER